MKGLREVVGFLCSIEFDQHGDRWARTQGMPAFLVVVDLDMPMVKLRSEGGRDDFWINAREIRLLRTVRFVGNEVAV